MKNTDFAVLFVDLQEGLVETGHTQKPEQLRRGAHVTAQIAKALSLPCYASGIPLGPQGAPPLIGEVQDVFPDLEMSIRRTFGFEVPASGNDSVFADRSRILLGGVLTEAAVLKTALNLKRAGLEVSLIVEACAGLSDRSEAAALSQLEAAGVQVTSIISLGAEQVDDLTSPSGSAVMGALRSLLA